MSHFEPRIESIIRSTSWGATLDKELIVSIGSFLDSIIRDEIKKSPNDTPTVLSKEEFDSLNKTIISLDQEDVDKSPLLSCLVWEQAGDYKVRATPMTLINSVLRNFVGPNYKLVVEVQKDGAASNIQVERDEV